MKKYFCFQGLFKNIGLRSVAKNFGKKYFKFLFTKCHDDSVKNESTRTKKLPGGAKRPPPSLFRVKKII